MKEVHRRCLKCNESFVAEGLYIRLCKSCKNENKKVSSRFFKKNVYYGPKYK